MTTGTKIFLAHSSIDKELVRKLYHELKNRGLDPWLDEEDILPGQSWTFEIPNAIQQCDYFMACLSERAIKRQGYMHKEFRMALDIYTEKTSGSICLIPLKFDDCEVPEIQLPQLGVNLRHIQWLDYWKPNGLSRLLEVFEKEVSSKRSDQSVPVNRLGIEMVYLSSGEFMMGSPKKEKMRSDDETQHRVILTQGFYMGKTAVTVGQFRRFITATKHKIEAETWTGFNWDNPGFDQADTHPVTRVSWNNVQQFIHWLNNQEDQHYRLPTEAEWEYACRAGTTTPFSFGEKLSTDQTNYDGNYPYGNGPKGIYREKTTPVKNFPANAWGLYDMHGNVWEWCRDWKDDYPSGSVTDPKGPSSGTHRVLRGGCWFDRARYCRSACRSGNAPGNRDSYCGFRLVATENFARAPTNNETTLLFY